MQAFVIAKAKKLGVMPKVSRDAAKGKSVGGNGTKFEWSVLDDYHGPTPFILSGGIGPDDATSIRRFHHPQLAGIDLNSKFEDAPALKNIQKLKTFLEQL